MNRNLFKGSLSFWIIFISAVSLISTSGQMARAQDSKKVGKLNFQVPDDWPVEKRGGMMTPIPTEEYVSIKFKEIEREFQAVREEFLEKFGGLESGLKTLQEDLSQQTKKLGSQDNAQGGSGDLTEVLASLESLKNELARLDRKITNKTQETQLEFEKIGPRLKVIEDNLNRLQTQIYRLDEKVDYLEEDQLKTY